MSGAAGAPGGKESPLRAFIRRVLADEGHRTAAVLHLHAMAQLHRKRCSAGAAGPRGPEWHIAAARDCEALAALYAHADGPYRDAEEQWWDMGKWHGSRPTMTFRDNMADGRVGV